MKTYLNIEDLRAGARKRLPKGVFEYMDLGAEDMVALNNNRDAFRRIQLCSRIMKDVSKMDLSTSLFGKKIALPIGIAPTAISGLCWHEGEVALARAARAKGVPFILSTNSITPLEKVAELAGGQLWFQLYMWREREMSYQLVRRAQAAGYEALVVSADFGHGSNRESAKRNGFSVPYKASTKSVVDMLRHPSWLSGVMLRYLATKGMPKNENFPVEYQKMISANPSGARSALRADSLAWSDLDRLRDHWQGPLLVKGVMHPDDARMAVEHGADGVIVSNHGGRNLDSSLAAIDALPAIVDAVGDRTTVIMDSGIRRGSDIAKALVYGAKAVLVGRATLYGVSVGGQAGAERALQLLTTELDKTMAFLGCGRLDELGRDLLAHPYEEPARQQPVTGLAAE